MRWQTIAPFAAFVSCSLIWGSTFLVISIGNDTVPPMWAATIRLVLASILLSMLVKLTRQRFPRGEALKAAFWYGFFEFGVNFTLLYWGEKRVPSGIAALLYATIPLSAMLFARIFGIERLNLLKLMSAILALIGVAIIFSGELGAGVPMIPFIAVLCSATSASLAGILLKRGPPQSALASNAVGAAIGALFCLIASTWSGEPRDIPKTFAQWFPILYLTLAGSVVAFVLFAWLIHRWSASTVSYIAVIIPVIALLLGALMRHERLVLFSFLGAALVLVGVVVALQSDRLNIKD